MRSQRWVSCLVHGRADIQVAKDQATSPRSLAGKTLVSSISERRFSPFRSSRSNDSSLFPFTCSSENDFGLFPFTCSSENDYGLFPFTCCSSKPLFVPLLQFPDCTGRLFMRL